MYPSDESLKRLNEYNIIVETDSTTSALTEHDYDYNDWSIEESDGYYEKEEYTSQCSSYNNDINDDNKSIYVGQNHFGGVLCGRDVSKGDCDINLIEIPSSNNKSDSLFFFFSTKRRLNKLGEYLLGTSFCGIKRKTKKCFISLKNRKRKKSQNMILFCYNCTAVYC